MKYKKSLLLTRFYLGKEFDLLIVGRFVCLSTAGHSLYTL